MRWLSGCIVLFCSGLAAPADARPAGSCTQRVDKLVRVLQRQIPAAADMRHLSPQLVKLNGAKIARRRLPVVYIDDKQVTIGDTAVLTAGQAAAEKLQPFAARMTTLRNNAALVKQPWHNKVHLAVASRARWDAVRGVLRILQRLQIKQVGLLFAIDDPGPRPRGTRVDAEVDRIVGPALSLRQGPALHELFARLTKRCPGAPGAFAGADALDPTPRARQIVKKLARALRACRCAADVEAVTAAIHPLFHVAPTGVVWTKLVKRGRRLRRPGKETWALSFRHALGRRGKARPVPAMIEIKL